MYEKFLSTVTLLNPLDGQERSKIADALVSKVYEDGQDVVRQGDMGDTFFFVEEGEAVVSKVQDDEGVVREIIVGTLTKGDYFGGKSKRIILFQMDDEVEQSYLFYALRHGRQP